MTKKHSTKRALFLSAMSMLLCIAMLVGTTFAWFTDSVKSAKNRIVAGNLDVELYYQIEGQSDWKKVTESSNVFKEGALWEPGHTEVVKLKVVNEGTLALKYKLGVNIAKEQGSVNVNGENFELSNFIKYGVVDGYQSYTRDQAIEAVDTTASTLKVPYGKAGNLDAKNDQDSDEKIITMVVYMPTSVGNEANYAKDAMIPEIELGISLFATQYTHESDSFDNMYDEEAAVFTVEEANDLMARGKNATLVDCIDPNGILSVPANYAGTLAIVDSTVKSVQGAGDVQLVILGSVVINAKNGNGRTVFDGSAITAKGKLSISGNGNLTAIAADVAGAFGIGGMETSEITVKDVFIDYVSGGYAYAKGSDTKYYKDAPEGGAAIGSGLNGATITLDNVTVTKAIGGSKAASIGARYHVGVTVNIEKSEIIYVEGGVSAAGIGGSRVSGDASENETVINIRCSTINAKGGAYGAGIGSGYDTHCLSKQPLCTINISDSDITAEGGTYAAGVGTGYHNAALSGEIKNSTVNAKSGEAFYKETYTSAMDIGFGVVDPAREGQQVDSYIDYTDKNSDVTITYKIPQLVDEWDGKADTSWYDPKNPKTEYELGTASQLAGLAELVAGDTTFKGVTITLTNDIDLYCEDTTPAADGDPLTFRPIGDHSKNGTFEGVFDGNGKTIYNIYQNGWDLGYEWGVYGSYGLFGNLNNATVKNLTLSGGESYIEGGDVSFVAGSATGTCVFENITIKDSVAATYNNGCGGIIGWSGAGNYTFKNITISEDCVLGGLWGSFDSSIGGIVGQAEPGATYNLENVNVACRIDAYNDCTASYDYYNYRMCGMLIGRLEETTTIDGANYPDTSKYTITCKNVNVTYGEWANYHYCEPTPGLNGGRGMRVEPGYAYDGLPADYDHSQCVDNHMNLIPFDQIFGGDQIAVKGLKTYDGVNVIYNNK